MQPLDVSVELRTDFKASSDTDDLRYSLNYAVISRNITEFFEKNKGKNFKSLQNVAKGVADVVLDEKKGGGQNARVSVSGRKTEIRAQKIEVVLNREKTDASVSKIDGFNDTFLIHGIKCSTLIGVFTFERLQKQFVSLDLEITAEDFDNVDIYQIIDDVATYVDNSNFKTVEALIECVAQIVCQYPILGVVAKVEKPNAITFAEGVGVQVTRTPKDFEGKAPISTSEEIQKRTTESLSSFNLPSAQETAVAEGRVHTAYIAVGSNVGSPVENIIKAIEQLNQVTDTKVVQTSSLYESEPMYHLDQDKFINGVFEITTKLTPQSLLKILKEIEYNVLGRVKLIENGPRSIDLDILLYDDLVLNDTQVNLTIPHISMLERTFVLQPLCELVPPTYIHPLSAEPIHNHLKQLYVSTGDASKQKSNRLSTHVPLFNALSNHHDANAALTFDLTHHTHRTRLMGILNTTPDSFSDGGRSASLPLAIENALKMVHAGVDIIDIGGVSTRPGSIAPDAEEEWRRVVPIVKGIREHADEKLRNVIISVDTYRAKIARDAIEAGADIINDISGGLFDEDMFKVVAETGVPYVLNHTRGTPDTMSKLNHYENSEDAGLVEYFKSEENIDESEENVLLKAVSRELCVQYRKAIDAGVKRWQIITDPGIGFAKNLRQNLAIIRGTPLIKSYSNFNEDTETFNSLEGLPILLGPSRKKFIGTLTNEKVPSERVLTTGAVIMSCVGYQSDIVRVHDVEEVKKVLLIGDALYRDVL